MASTIPRTIPFVLGSSDAAVTPPAAVTGLTAAARAGGAQVTWTAPAGATDYTLVASGGSVSRRYAFTAGSPVAINGLVNGVAYTLTLVARNAAGSSPAATTTVTPSGAAIVPGSDGALLVTPAAIAPDVPTAVAVTGNDAAAVATWAAPTDDGGSPVLGYQVVVTTVADGTAVLTVQAGGGATSAVLTPLQNDTQYAVTVAAFNSVGTSQPSAPVLVTPAAGSGTVTPPDAPPPVHQTVPQPALWAFPADRAFHPDNWLMTAEEVDAR